MIPCKMPDESAYLLAETIELLDKAGERATELLEISTDNDNASAYLQIVLDLDSLKQKAMLLNPVTSTNN